MPIIGAVTPSFAMHQAREIWAMLTPFFFASSSILVNILGRRMAAGAGITHLLVSSGRKAIS